MHQLKPLEDCILERYQYLLDEFEHDNFASEIVAGFVDYGAGCIAMFKRLHPEVPLLELRPFFGQQDDPRPLQSTNEAAFWVHDLARQLEQDLREKQQQASGST
ncbi:hypothetical protein [Roseateles sp.]|uniref:hypothetical protein n=1 Tax=Roseateles sp. TaxID=1971397 RepID=UPI003264AC2B